MDIRSLRMCGKFWRYPGFYIVSGAAAVAERRLPGGLIWNAVEGTGDITRLQKGSVQLNLYKTEWESYASKYPVCSGEAEVMDQEDSFWRTCTPVAGYSGRKKEMKTLEYYRCYFEDAGIENEASVLEELGSPQQVADSLKRGIDQPADAGEYTENGYQTVDEKQLPWDRM